MSDDIIPEQTLTIPIEYGKKEEVLRQMVIRLHHHDQAMLKVMLKKDELSFQKFALFCVRAYLDGDPHLLKMLKIYRELEAVPQDIRDKHVLSHRERQDIYKELEKAQAEKDIL